MEIKQLRYFLAAIDAGNITRAAQLLHIAQPALSYHILNLEGELKTKLLNRTTSGVTPTSNGELLYRHAKGILRQLDDIRVAVEKGNASPSGRVTVGIPGSTARVLAVPLLEELKRFPGILLEVVERQSGEMTALVAQGRLEMAITVDAHSTHGVIIQPLVSEELYVILPKAPKGSHGAISLADLIKFPLALPSAPNLTRVKLDLAMIEANLAYTLVAEASTTDLLIRIVRSGTACTILPWSAVSEEIRLKQVYAVRMEKPTLKRELSLCLLESVPLSQAAQVVHQLITDKIPQLIAEGKWHKSS